MMKPLLVLSSLLILAACGGGSQPQQSQPAPATPVQTEENAAPANPVLSDLGTQGKSLYESNCAACHYLDKKLIGPALQGANSRYEEAWLIKFIKNSQAMIKAGDPLAKQVYEDNNRMVMNSNEHLSDDEIKSILVYIKEAGN
ncbi:MAG: cytochrome c [Bacteroidetes bacterium]|nr:MAG: cytochrome c [Bacteroidota bacterium]